MHAEQHDIIMVACEHTLGVGRMTHAQQEQHEQNQQQGSPTATPHMRTADFDIYFLHGRRTDN
jgi:hypothetical protein